MRLVRKVKVGSRLEGYLDEEGLFVDRKYVEIHDINTSDIELETQISEKYINKIKSVNVYQYIKREEEKTISDSIKNNRITILYGPRYVGKSYLAIKESNKLGYNTVYRDLEINDLGRIALSNLERYSELKKKGQVVYIIDNISKINKDELNRIDKDIKIVLIYNKIIENGIFIKSIGFNDFNRHIKNNSIDENYRLYKEIGGYPSVILEYIKTNDIKTSIKIYEKIIYDSIPKILPNKKLQILVEDLAYCMLGDGKSKKKLKSRYVNYINRHGFIGDGNDIANKLIDTLRVNGIIDYSHCNKIAGVDKELKAYFLDSGMLNAIMRKCSAGKSRKIGFMTENFVYVELYSICKNGRFFEEVPYFSLYKNYEIDFMLTDKIKNETYIFEVKTSGNNYSAKSFDFYLNERLVDYGLKCMDTDTVIHNENRCILPVYNVREEMNSHVIYDSNR